jgi:hypothetical protein
MEKHHRQTETTPDNGQHDNQQQTTTTERYIKSQNLHPITNSDSRPAIKGSLTRDFRSQFFFMKILLYLKIFLFFRRCR